MSEFTLEETGLDIEEVGGFDQSNVKRLRSGDGSWRMEKGAIIITDESGIDRVIIGYLKDGF